MQNRSNENAPDPVCENEILDWFSEMGIGFAPKPEKDAPQRFSPGDDFKDAA
ncbi:MAG TPA: hypothetical protein VN577_03675 [Terriglobales bacterium]|nr:hypothetical protein [Terriglobales bacterium]